MEDAVECYQRAANLYKMSKSWAPAGNAFCEAANLHIRSGARHDAATNFVDAANCYKKSDINGESSNIVATFPFNKIADELTMTVVIRTVK